MGFAFAAALAKSAAELIIIGSNEQRLQSAKEELENTYNVKVHILRAGLTEQNSISNIIKLLNDLGLLPDLLINNAGIGFYGNYTDLAGNDDLNVINVNVLAPTILTREILQRKKPNKDITILNISSTIAFRKSPGWAVYSATKAYIFSLTRTLSMEYKRQGVQFSLLCPGKINTEFDKKAGISYRSQPGKDSPDEIAEYTLKKIYKGKEIVIPGLKNKAKYYFIKYMPDFVSDFIIGKL